MTPSNQHSDEAIAAYPDAPFTEVFGRHQSIIDQRTAFDRGRESKQRTDRETIAALIGAQERWTSTSSYVTTTDALIAADAILAAPSLSLVAARRDFAEKASAHMRANGHGFTRRIDMELLYDALFASGILKPSSEVEAAALSELRTRIEEELELGGDASTLSVVVGEWLAEMRLIPSAQPTENDEIVRRLNNALGMVNFGGYPPDVEALIELIPNPVNAESGHKDLIRDLIALQTILRIMKPRSNNWKTVARAVAVLSAARVRSGKGEA